MTTNFSTTTATGATEAQKHSIHTALGSIDKARFLVALLDDATDHADEIHLEGDGMYGFKHAMLEIRDELQEARKALEEIVYRVPQIGTARGSIDRARAGAE